eukprot:365813-Chlamydomonas_euryale.AAC.18
MKRKPEHGSVMRTTVHTCAALRQLCVSGCAHFHTRAAYFCCTALGSSPAQHVLRAHIHACAAALRSVSRALMMSMVDSAGRPIAASM